VTKANGVRHWSRQRYFSALNWNSPAAASTTAPAIQPCPASHGLRPPSQATPASSACAISPNANHATKKPASTRTSRRRASARERVMTRKMPSTGYVVGSIIAAIISTHASA
jgi:hypothetical protein